MKWGKLSWVGGAGGQCPPCSGGRGPEPFWVSAALQDKEPSGDQPGRTHLLDAPTHLRSQVDLLPMPPMAANLPGSSRHPPPSSYPSREPLLMSPLRSASVAPGLSPPCLPLPNAIREGSRHKAPQGSQAPEAKPPVPELFPPIPQPLHPESTAGSSCHPMGDLCVSLGPHLPALLRP